ncbi:NUDIX domain-containing protein [Streptomyces sp. 8N706]|uniref:NUDIX domain-containing protein n=1 Tax=Streptomyces sp. 8N706 TaxID=3457416 RepID=UPI003FD36F38
MTDGYLPRDEYIATLPKATAYAGMYFTDADERPVMLKSVYGTKAWQFPGGNMDPGESPWETAVRETREETGLIISGTRPLLLAHFLPPEDRWPFNKFGFIFDGGTLTEGDLAGIVLDPTEHCDWSVRTMAEWERTTTAPTFARLVAVHAARTAGTARYMEQSNV